MQNAQEGWKQGRARSGDPNTSPNMGWPANSYCSAQFVDRSKWFTMKIAAMMMRGTFGGGPRIVSSLFAGSLRYMSSGMGSGALPDDDIPERPSTPWVRQVISGVDLMRHPKYNKGMAFSDGERDRQVRCS